MRNIKTWHFNGGLHLEEFKEISTQEPVEPAPIPRRLILPLHQHIGEQAEPIVEIGDKVLKGQQIARATGYVSLPVHASSSGTVVDINDYHVPHPSGLKAPCIVIDTDSEDQWIKREPVNYQAFNPSQLRNIIREAGIAGLGGAGFPSFIKMNPGINQSIDTLILNGAECEPYITCDDMLMRERPHDIIAGLKIIRHALNASRVLIGIEDNKPEAIKALREATSDEENVDVVAIPSLYPAGGEKQIIKVLTGKEVPSNGLPPDIGVVCHNVATAVAVYRAVDIGEPLISRYVTVTGSGITRPRNLDVRFGTPMDELIVYCGGHVDNIDQIVMGGPMMGFTLMTPDAPIIKTTNCILANKDALPEQPAMPCIRCGDCAAACPVNLLPQQIYWHARAREFDRIQDYNLFDCIECGCCAYVCPSHIPLVQYYRFAKTTIWQQERDKKKSDIARQRHEFRLERLERDKQERAERHRRKREALANKASGKAGSSGDIGNDEKKKAIMAALERVSAKKTEKKTWPKNIDSLTPEQLKLIKEVDERRARAKQKRIEAINSDSAPETVEK